MMRCLIAALALAALVSPASAQSAAQNEDLARMQGSWVLIGGRLNGRDLSPVEAQLADIAVTIKKDRMSVTFKGKASDSVSSIKLDPGKTPKQVDSEDIEGPGKGTKNQGIYA